MITLRQLKPIPTDDLSQPNDINKHTRKTGVSFHFSQYLFAPVPSRPIYHGISHPIATHVKPWEKGLEISGHES